MSHVDDGELTAYADGAYPVDDPDALRISAHLSTCANCRTRLEQNQELRDRATTILSYAAPASVQAPAFESLQAQVAPAVTRRMPRLTSLAWAATIVLALGIGWFGRGAFQDMPLAEMASTAEESAGAASEPATLPPQAPAPAPMAATTADAPTANRQQTTEQANVRARTGAAAERVAAVPPPAPAPAAVPPPAAAEDVSGFAERDRALAAAVVDMRSYTAAEAERAGIKYPRIPELPVSSIQVAGDVIVVHHMLPDSTELRLQVADVPPAAEAAERRAAGRAEMAQKVAAPTPVTVKVGDKLVIVTGALPPDSLRALAEKVR